MTVQDDKVVASRERLLQTAFQLFHEQGYHATGVATILREAGVNAGFDFAGYCSQASFLTGNGLPQQLLEIEGIADEAERYRRHQEIKQLTLPAEMGERFQVMAFQRGADIRASFHAGDLSRRL